MDRIRPHGVLKNTLITGLTLTALTACEPVVHATTPQDAQLRDTVLSTHNVRPEAQELLDTVPFVNMHTTVNGGGKTYAFPFVHVEVYSNQEEAVLHEESHAFFDKTINNEKTFCDGFENAVKEAADDPKGDPYYHTLYYGDGGDFKGLKDNCNETYASISSYSMGNKDKVPVGIRNFYRTLYTWK